MGLAFTFTGCASNSESYLFHQIKRLEGIPVEEQLLYYDSQPLDDTQTLASYRLHSLCYIDFLRTGRPLKRPRLGSASHPSNLDIELLSALPTLSRYAKMRLVPLDEGSPRGAAVRRLFLDSITRHRGHFISHCPSPPCTHFAPKMKLEVVSVRWLLSRGLLDMYCVKRERIEGLRRSGCAELPEEFARAAVRLQSVDAGTPCLNAFHCFMAFGIRTNTVYTLLSGVSFPLFLGCSNHLSRCGVAFLVIGSSYTWKRFLPVFC